MDPDNSVYIVSRKNENHALLELDGLYPTVRLKHDIPEIVNAHEEDLCFKNFTTP